LLHGHDQHVHVQYTTRNAGSALRRPFEGAIPYLERKHAEAADATSPGQFAGSCGRCRAGLPRTRLKPAALAVTVGGRSIADFCALPIGELATQLLGWSCPGNRPVSVRSWRRFSRLTFLLDMAGLPDA